MENKPVMKPGQLRNGFLIIGIILGIICGITSKSFYAFLFFVAVFYTIGFFAERDMRKKEKNQLPQRNYNPDTPTQPIATRSGVMRLTEIDPTFFKAAHDMAQRIIRYQRSLEADTALTTVIDEAKGLDELDNIHFVQASHNSRLSIFLLHDLLICHKRLGHKVDSIEKRALAPIDIYLLYLTAPDQELNYDKFNDLMKVLRVEYNKMMHNLVSIKMDGLDGDYDFWITPLLKSYNPEMYTEFLERLYDWASFMAQSDGIVSDRERQWLKGLKDNIKKEQEAAQNPATFQEEEKIEEVKPALERLNALTGLDSVKEEVTRLSNFISVNEKRKQSGLKTSAVSYHCVFTGNPGTGKTTVARIIADIYRDCGVLKSGHLVETDRSGLVGEYVGQTAVKTNAIVDSALDGVLFIDEAYSLVQGGENDYGNEAIATLLKRMEDNRDRLVVILAGYSDDMKQFIDANPGLQSRFNRYIHFPDYSVGELATIFKSIAASNDYILSPEAETRLFEMIITAVKNKNEKFGNARFARNLFEKSIENQASRLALTTNVSTNDLRTLTPDDLHE